MKEINDTINLNSGGRREASEADFLRFVNTALKELKSYGNTIVFTKEHVEEIRKLDAEIKVTYKEDYYYLIESTRPIKKLRRPREERL